MSSHGSQIAQQGHNYFIILGHDDSKNNQSEYKAPGEALDYIINNDINKIGQIEFFLLNILISVAMRIIKKLIPLQILHLMSKWRIIFLNTEEIIKLSSKYD